MTTLTQDAVKRAHPEATIKGVPDEVLETLYPELFNYGPATVSFRKSAEGAISFFVPYKGSLKQLYASRQLTDMVDEFHDGLTVRGAFLQIAQEIGPKRSYYDEDFPQLAKMLALLKKKSSVGNLSSLDNTHVQLGQRLYDEMHFRILPTLLICLTEQTMTHDYKLLREKSAAFLKEYSCWEKKYVNKLRRKNAL